MRNFNDMEYKHITPASASVLASLSGEGRRWFTMSQAYELCPDTNPVALRSQIKRMCDAGLLLRLKKDTYWVIPYEMDSPTFMPSWHLLAEPLASGTHYVGFYSALQLHGLITQPSIKEQIVVDRKMSSYATKVRDIEFQFIALGEQRFFGFKKIWIDDYDKVFCSDLEKTFIDCLYMPHYAGGVIEIAKALYMAKDRINFSRLVDYAERFGVGAVCKRLSFLLELMAIDNPIIERLQALKTATIVPLDTEVPAIGKITARWSIMQNVDTQTIKTSIES